MCLGQLWPQVLNQASGACPQGLGGKGRWDLHGLQGSWLLGLIHVLLIWVACSLARGYVWFYPSLKNVHLFLRLQGLIILEATLTHHLGPEFILFQKLPPYFSFSS